VLEELSSQDLVLIHLYARTNPGVVSIDTAIRSEDEIVPFGSGSGFIYGVGGTVVTNYHVVAPTDAGLADVIWVTFSDGSVRGVEVLGADPYSDLAVLQVTDLPAGAVPLELGDSDTLEVGQRVIAIGNPYGRAGTLTVGIISGLGRTLSSVAGATGGRFAIPEVIQTDASINPGNSGGPLLDTQGRVVGVNTAVQATGLHSGVGFAVPVNIVRRVVPDLIENGTYTPPYLGLTDDGRLTLAEINLELDLPTERGVLVASVEPGGPAARAGIQGGNREVEVMGMEVVIGGDIILAVNDVRVNDFQDLIAYLVRETEVGQTVTLRVLRDGETLEIPVELGRPPWAR
jgi:2-alkenal reductase